MLQTQTRQNLHTKKSVQEIDLMCTLNIEGRSQILEVRFNFNSGGGECLNKYQIQTRLNSINIKPVIQYFIDIFNS